ncbi:hypothetical protein [uncultured Helicobacter sp.]|uniref:hypothetical protein n=1 Tax=uncultured Helicobacter sp. TaxID=175537 RepID=UPI00374F47EF
MQVLLGKTCESLVESESPLAPLRDHTADFLESKALLGVSTSGTPLGLAHFL